MKKVIKWLKTNKLSLNLKKTHYILFRKRRDKVTIDRSLVVDNVNIENVKQSKFLGVIIDQNLTFYDHIQYMKGKISRALGILYKCRKYFKQSTLITLYNAFIYPYFTYCIPVWGNNFQSYLHPLILLQKRAIRTIANAEFRANTAPLFKSLKILNLSKIHVYCVQLFAYKYAHGSLPTIFNTFFTQNSLIHHHFTRQSRQFHVPLYNCSQAYNSVRCFGVKSFNYFDSRIDMNCSYCCYKRHLKYYLIDNDIPFIN